MQPAETDIAGFVRYSADANRRLLTCCEGLSSVELESDLGGSFNSILNTLWHIYDAEHFWIDNLLTGTIPPLKSFGDPSPISGIPPDFELLCSRWPGVWQRMEAGCASLSERDWKKVVTCELHDRREMELSRQQVAMHMVNHSTMHRGQVLHMLRQLRKTPVNVDLFGYYIAAWQNV